VTEGRAPRDAGSPDLLEAGPPARRVPPRALVVLLTLAAVALAGSVVNARRADPVTTRMAAAVAVGPTALGSPGALLVRIPVDNPGTAVQVRRAALQAQGFRDTAVTGPVRLERGGSGAFVVSATFDCSTRLADAGLSLVLDLRTAGGRTGQLREPVSFAEGPSSGLDDACPAGPPGDGARADPVLRAQTLPTSSNRRVDVQVFVSAGEQPQPVEELLAPGLIVRSDLALPLVAVARATTVFEAHLTVADCRHARGSGGGVGRLAARLPGRPGLRQGDLSRLELDDGYDTAVKAMLRTTCGTGG